MSLRGILYSFNGGELSPRMDGRVDLDGIYDRGFAEMVNFVGTVEGPAVKRPGFRHIRPAASSASWLTKFVFNTTQSYVLEWSDLKLRFYTNDGRIETDADTPYEVDVPYTAAQASRLSYAQSFDRQVIAHEAHPPAVLTRTGATTFTHADLDLRNGPFQDTNSNEAQTVTVSGTLTKGGTATITANAAIFHADMIGSPIMVEADDFSDIRAWEPGYDDVSIGDKLRSDGKAYEAKTAGRTGTVQPTHVQGTEWDGRGAGQDVNENDAGGIQFEYLHDRYGIGKILTVAGDQRSCTVQVTRRFPDSLTSVASHRWALGAFSEHAGWPHLVVIANGRMIFFKGIEVFGSVVNDYGGGQANFAPLTDSGLFAADMAFRRTLEITDPPLWVRADKEAIVIGTSQGEFLITAQNPAETLSGDNFDVVPQSHYGSAEVWPIDIGTAGLFVQRGKRKIREAEFTFDRDRFVGLNITVWARHISRSGIKQLAFQQEPEEMLWAVRNDGVLVAHPHSPEQQVKGFSRNILGAGDALSNVSIPSTDGDRDDYWILAELNGAKHVLQMAEWWDEDGELTEDERLEKLKDAFFVDYGVSYDGVAQDEFNDGLDHLIGEEVWILADGGVVPPQVVQATNPKIKLPRQASKVHIGKGYVAKLKPMRPEVRGVATVQGLRKRVTNLLMRVLDTVLLKVQDPQREELVDNLFDRPGSSKMDEPVPLYSGDTENKSIGGGYDRKGQYVVISDAPTPATITAMFPTMAVESVGRGD